MLYLLIKTLITAIAVIIVSEIAKRSSLLAGIIASIPLTSFLAFIWIYWETKDSQKIIDLSYSSMFMVIPSFTFFIVLPFALKLHISFLTSIVIATISTALIYWIFVEMLNKFGLNL